MIISDGANIFPAEIESAMIEMPQRLDCAVFGIADKEFGKRILVHTTFKYTATVM